MIKEVKIRNNYGPELVGGEVRSKFEYVPNFISKFGYEVVIFEPEEGVVYFGTVTGPNYSPTIEEIVGKEWPCQRMSLNKLYEFTEHGNPFTMNEFQRPYAETGHSFKFVLA